MNSKWTLMGLAGLGLGGVLAYSVLVPPVRKPASSFADLLRRPLAFPKVLSGENTILAGEQKLCRRGLARFFPLDLAGSAEEASQHVRKIIPSLAECQFSEDSIKHQHEDWLLKCSLEDGSFHDVLEDEGGVTYNSDAACLEATLLLRALLYGKARPGQELVGLDDAEIATQFLAKSKIFPRAMLPFGRYLQKLFPDDFAVALGLFNALGISALMNHGSEQSFAAAALAEFDQVRQIIERQIQSEGYSSYRQPVVEMVLAVGLVRSSTAQEMQTLLESIQSQHPIYRALGLYYFAGWLAQHGQNQEAMDILNETVELWPDEERFRQSRVRLQSTEPGEKPRILTTYVEIDLPVL